MNVVLSRYPNHGFGFHEVEGGNDIQYSDGTDINIVTLNTFKAEQFNISEEEYANWMLWLFPSSILTSKEQSSDFSRFGAPNRPLEVMKPMLSMQLLSQGNTRYLGLPIK